MPATTRPRPADTDEPLAALLRSRGIRPTAHRLAVAQLVVAAPDAHPSADDVWKRVFATFPKISRATLYNTLNALVEAGLLRRVSGDDGVTRFDPNLDPHHHFIDEETGRIIDVPMQHLTELTFEGLSGDRPGESLEVHSYRVVMRGRIRRRRGAR